MVLPVNCWQVVRSRYRAAAHPGRLSGMPAWQSYSYLFGPIVAFVVVGVLALLLRWAFGRGGSLVARTPAAGREDEYGLLVAVAAPATYVEGEILRRRLETAGLRATLTTTSAGPRLMVWQGDERRARALLARPER